MEELYWPKRTYLSFLLVTINYEGVLSASSFFGVTIFDGELLDRIVEGLGPPMLKLGCSSLMIDSSMESSTLICITYLSLPANEDHFYISTKLCFVSFILRAHNNKNVYISYLKILPPFLVW